MQIGVLGSGDAAKVMATGYLKHGHDAMLGTDAPLSCFACGPARTSMKCYNDFICNADSPRVVSAGASFPSDRRRRSLPSPLSLRQHLWRPP